MSRMRLLCLLLLLPALAVGLFTAPAQSAGPEATERDATSERAEPKTSLAEIEDEVMCPVCGTLLGLSQAPQADRERALIQRLIDQGLSKEEIKRELVAEYGPGVLALPESSGFNLAAYVVPIVGLIMAAILLFLAVRRWRRQTAGSEAAPPAAGGDPGAGEKADAGLDPEEAERLDRDLARYDL